MNKTRKVNFDAVVAEYLNDLRLRNLSARTLQSYTSVIGRFRGFVAGDSDVQVYLDQVTPERAKIKPIPLPIQPQPISTSNH